MGQYGHCVQSRPTSLQQRQGLVKKSRMSWQQEACGSHEQRTNVMSACHFESVMSYQQSDYVDQCVFTLRTIIRQMSSLSDLKRRARSVFEERRSNSKNRKNMLRVATLDFPDPKHCAKIIARTTRTRTARGVAIWDHFTIQWTVWKNNTTPVQRRRTSCDTSD